MNSVRIKKSPCLIFVMALSMFSKSIDALEYAKVDRQESEVSKYMRVMKDKTSLELTVEKFNKEDVSAFIEAMIHFPTLKKSTVSFTQGSAKQFKQLRETLTLFPSIYRHFKIVYHTKSRPFRMEITRRVIDAAVVDEFVGVLKGKTKFNFTVTRLKVEDILALIQAANRSIGLKDLSITLQHIDKKKLLRFKLLFGLIYSEMSEIFPCKYFIDTRRHGSVFGMNKR